MIKRFAWLEGSGEVTATYNGMGDGAISFSSKRNDGIDRSLTLTVGNDSVSEQIIVNQIGKREVFEPDEFFLSDGGTFNVLKEEYK